MLRNLLLCGLLAGLCGGLLATGFARVVGETQINQAIAFEDSQYKAQGLPPEKEIVSRSLFLFSDLKLPRSKTLYRKSGLQRAEVLT